MAESPNGQVAVPEEHAAPAAVVIPESSPAAVIAEEPAVAAGGRVEPVLAAAGRVEPKLTPAQLRQNAAEAEAAAHHPNGKHHHNNHHGRYHAPTTIDVASDDAFPSLGKAPTKTAAAVKWGAGTGPVFSFPAHSAAKWAPAVGSTSQQLIYTLQREYRRPIPDAKRSEVTRDVARRTGTKIEAANNKERGTITFVILGGTAADRDRAKLELTRELTVRVCYYPHAQ